jgi:hypothetical protein
MPDMKEIYSDAVDAIRIMSETFTLTVETEGLGLPKEEFVAALEKLETHERRPTTYALVLLALVSIRGAAMKMDLDEPQFLAEIAKGVGVDI